MWWTQFRKYFISLILSYKVSKKTALLRCTANQAGTDHKLNFQPKIQLGPNWQQSTTKMAVAGLRCNTDSFGCVLSFILTYKVRKNTALLCCTTNQVGTDHKLQFQPKHPARAKLAAINNNNGCGTPEVWWTQFRKYFISLILSYKISKKDSFAPLYLQPSRHRP